MGKAQSKRSVDITTESKKDGGIEEGTGELKKIEEVDFKAQPANGDTTTHVNETTGEKPTAETTETENEKDSSTEKELQRVTQSSEGAAAGDAPVADAASDAKVDENVTDKSTVDTAEESLNENKSSTSGSETPDSTSKKNKKEKVKKKWSFRSISFGKKDKQKPSKKEEGALSPNTSGVSVNGECEKVPEEGAEEALPAVEKKEDVATPVEVTVTAAEEVKAIAEEEPQPLKEETKTVNETSSPVLNGVSEVKEEITPAAEKEIEKIVETVPEVKEIITATESPVIENKTPEPVTNGDKHHDEISSKMNGSVEAPKTEVKNDDILIEKELQILNIIKEQNDENIVQNVNSTNELKNLDGESTLPPPPPLPTTLPPSQVMVFALSETTQEQKNDVILPLDTDIPVNPPPVVEENLISNKLDDAINILKNDEHITNIISIERPSEISLKQDEIKTDVINVGETKSNEVSLDEKITEVISLSETKTEAVSPGETKTEVITENIEVKQLESEEKIPLESIDAKNLGSEVETANEKSEVEPVQNIDQIVDDMTQVVTAETNSEQDLIAAQLAVENMLKENNLTNETTENKEEEKIPTEIFEGVTVEEIIIGGITPNEFLDNIINGKTTYDETSTSMDSQSQTDNGKTTESSVDDELPSPPPTPPAYIESDSLITGNTNIVSDMNKINENFDKMSLENNENKTDLIASDLSSKSNNDVTDNPDDAINATKAGGQKQQQQNQNNKKENGVDENHQNNETSATENLNGVDHAKTIEEIKAENQQLDKSAAEITQDTAIIAAE